MISQKIPYFYPLSIEDILNFNSKKHPKKIWLFITSSNNQKFFCYKNKDNKMEYYKIENNKYSIPKQYR